MLRGGPKISRRTIASRRPCRVASRTRKSDWPAGATSARRDSDAGSSAPPGARISKIVSLAIAGLNFRGSIRCGIGGGFALNSISVGSGGGAVVSGGSGDLIGGGTCETVSRGLDRRAAVGGGLAPGGWPSASRKRRTRSSSVWLSLRGIDCVGVFGGCETSFLAWPFCETSHRRSPIASATRMIHG